MGPPRRENAMNVNRSSVLHHESHENKHRGSPKLPKVQRNRTPAPSQPTPQSSMGMSPMSRYNHNLKVLRRRDPSIMSIFDQFSHVCVYHHNGMKWEKQGFEGSMFLYERDSYPPYGFYILNRMGMEDYIQRLYPEDDIHAHGSYLMIRSYPDFTAQRINNILSSHSNTLPEIFSDVFIVPNLENLGHNDKGRSQTVGLWMFTTDKREPLIDVMLRLHSYIKKNLPYPDEFRYGPGNPPPPNPHPHKSTVSRKASRVDTNCSQSNNDSQSYESTSENESITSSDFAHYSLSDGPSDLDKLFMKLQSTPASSSVNTVSTQPSLLASSSTIPPVSQSTSTMTVDSLFAALAGTEPTQTPPHSSTHDPTVLRPTSSQAPSIAATSKATTLLNSIFASATPINTDMNTVATSIYSPTPTVSSAPQVLSQDVLSNLLGLPPSRSASVVSASSAHSSNAPSLLSAFSHPSSREGDDEDDGGIDDAQSLFTNVSDRESRRRSGSSNGAYSLDGGYSETSTVLDTDPEPDNELPMAGSGFGRPLQTAENLLWSSGQTINGRKAHDQGGCINGDATPRPPAFIHSCSSANTSLSRMNSASKLQGSLGIQRGEKAYHGGTSTPPPAVVAPPPVEFSLSTLTVRAGSSNSHRRQSDATISTAKDGTNGSNHHPLVPFSTDSELWPYPPPQPSLSSKLDLSPNDNNNDELEDGEIIELDFEETSALSDLNSYRKAVQKGKERSRGQVATPAFANATVSASGSAGSGAESHGVSDVNGRFKGRRKSRRQKEAEKREQIENTWDTPAPVYNPLPGIPSGDSKASHARSPTPKKDRMALVVNGGHGGHQPRKQQVNEVNNGSSGSSGIPGNSAGAAVDSERVKDALITTLLGHQQKPGKLERNAFVREVLTLIHTDKTFVDALWEDYTNKLDA